MGNCRRRGLESLPLSDGSIGTFIYYLALVFIFSMPLLWISTVNYNLSRFLSREDGIVENLGALAFFFASVLSFLVFLKSSNTKHLFFTIQTKRNYFLLALALLFFICAGEEISWGQRLFGWETPASMKELNAQQETNIHNLWFFQAYRPDGSTKTWLENMLNANRLLSIFWLSYCVLVPIFSRLSTNLQILWQRIGFPVPPLWAGVPFVTSLVTLHILGAIGADVGENKISHLNELKESLQGLAFLLLALYFYHSRDWQRQV